MTDMDRFTSPHKDSAALDEFGGVLLDQGDHYLVGYPPDDLDTLPHWFGRSPAHIDSLAPSYDETDPSNTIQQMGLAL